MLKNKYTASKTNTVKSTTKGAIATKKTATHKKQIATKATAAKKTATRKRPIAIKSRKIAAAPLHKKFVGAFAILSLVVFGAIGVIGAITATVSYAATTTGPVVGNGSMCLDNSASRVANHNKIQLWDCNNTVAQKWTLSDDGTVKVQGYCLDVSGASKLEKTLVQLYQCNGTVAQKWVVNIAARTIINPNSGLCLDAKYSGISNGTQIWMYRCNGTAAQRWTTPTAVGTTPAPIPAPAPTPTPAPAPVGSTSKVLAVYWPGWNQGGPMTNVDTDYNLIYAFAATRTEGTGNLQWPYGNISGLQDARMRGQKVILSTGGAGQGINFNSRAISQQFVDSFKRIASSLGGVDGVDFNTFEADAAPNVTEYRWMATEFKRFYGPEFLVTSPPAPWSARDKAFCKEMISAALMDYCAPQYYDGPGLNTKSYVVNSVNEWVRDVAGGNASKIVVGLGINSPGYYMTTDVAVDTFRTVKANHPNIRGAFLWQRSADANAGWPFANQMGPIVRAR